MPIVTKYAIFCVLNYVLSFAFGQIDELENTLLWKIEGNGIEPSYVFGTLHLIPRSEFELKEKVLHAFNQCDKLVMELDVSQGNLQSEMIRYAQMKDSLSIEKFLTEGQYALVDSVLQETMKIGLEAFKQFKPFVLSTFLIPRYIEGVPASFELTFTQLAKQREISIQGLETIALQMSIFDRIPYEEQAEDLADMVANEDTYKQQYRDMLLTYREENIEQLFQDLARYLDSTLEMEELLTNRNRSWTAQVLELARESSTFFAVGAGHLAGPEGLLRLLEKEGFEVTPVLD